MTLWSFSWPNHLKSKTMVIKINIYIHPDDGGLHLQGGGKGRENVEPA